MFRIAPVPLVALLWIALVPSGAGACTCAPAGGIEQAFADATHVVRVNVRKQVRRIHRIRGVPTLDGSIHVYRAKIKRVYKGCLRRGRILKLFTASDPSLCGAVLDRRKDYVIALGEGDRRSFEINACGLIRPVESLSEEEIQFLDSRYECCDGRCGCAGSDPVACLLDPCEVESCGDATCVANYCGGCRAEFFDAAGRPVCTPCTDDLDCTPDQACEGGRCLPAATCDGDDTCPEGSWCRPTEAGGRTCVPMVSQGASCEGLLPPWAVERCGPDLACLPVEPPPGTPITPDAPGVCTPIDS